MRNKYDFFRIHLFMLGTMLLASCTKTKMVDYEKEAENKILEYKVTNAQQELLSAIDQQNNTITVLIPYYLGIDYLIAEVKLDDGAILVDALDNEIDIRGSLEPVALEDTVTYIIKSAQGEKRTYTLIQKILPYQDPLNVKILYVPEDSIEVNAPVNSRWILSGNFESVSRKAKLFFTNKSTGVTYDNWLIVSEVAPNTGNYGDVSGSYIMDIRISPEALAGEYDVKLVHQGRVANLKPFKLYYRFTSPENFTSSARYAPGDTIEFEAPNNSVFVGLERIYLKIFRETTVVNVDGGLPDSFYDTPIDLNIVSQSRSTIKALFPNIPAGTYRTITPRPNPHGNNIGFAFFGDFDNQTNWGNDVFIRRGSTFGDGFTVLP